MKKLRGFIRQSEFRELGVRREQGNLSEAI